jgi:hypothetical protein
MVLMNERIKKLNPLEKEIQLGIELGENYLGFIEAKQKALQVALRNNYKLPNDYMIGMFIGDGWFYIYIKIDLERNKLKIVVSMHIVQSTDCMDLLYAFQRTFGGKGFVHPDSPAKTDYVYRLEGVRNCLKYVVPLFDGYELSSTKQKQYSLFREVLMILKQRKHFTPDGLDKLIDLIYEFSSLSQGSRKLSKDQLKGLAKEYFKKRNIT